MSYLNSMCNIAKVFMGLIVLNLYSCGKEFLDIKSDKKIVIPTTISDAAAILENSSVMNEGRTPNLPDISSDDYEVPSNTFASLSPWEKNAYLWNSKIYVDTKGSENWSFSYQQIYYANLALEILEGVGKDGTNEKQYNSLKAQALFFRAWGHYQLVNLFCMAYDADATSELGIVIRLSTDLEEKISRSTLSESYESIISDLYIASTLHSNTQEHKTHPSKAAVLALLSKSYLMMGDYKNSLLYADSCLQYHSHLLDYNVINADAALPFERFNKEVIFHSTVNYAPIILGSNINISSSLYNLYEENDIRKRAFFTLRNGNLNFKGTYNNSPIAFGGITSAEVMLIKAECLTRENKLEEAKNCLVHFLKHRYMKGTSIIISESSWGSLLSRIWMERRKELLMRGIRWSDLKRINREGLNPITLSRNIDDQLYFLEANDRRYVLPIPDVVIETSGLNQNLR